MNVSNDRCAPHRSVGGFARAGHAELSLDVALRELRIHAMPLQSVGFSKIRRRVLEAPMMQGIVSDFDATSGVGIIESDDGDIVFFNTNNVETFDTDLLTIGLRVLFQSHEGELGPHADRVYLPQ